MWGSKYGAQRLRTQSVERKMWGSNYGGANCEAQSMGRKMWRTQRIGAQSVGAKYGAQSVERKAKFGAQSC